MSEDLVDISGVDKAELLAALYNNARAMGMGHFQARAGDMTKEKAQEVIDGHGDDTMRRFGRGKKFYFDYLFGRPLKVDLSGDAVKPWGYDRDWGKGALARIVSTLQRKP